jgi:hypothetical protein
MCVIDKCEFTNCGSGPYLLGDNFAVITNTVMAHMTGWGAQIVSTNKKIIDGCYFYDNLGDIYITASYQGSGQHNIIISNNIFESTRLRLFEIAEYITSNDAKNITITNSIVKNNIGEIALLGNELSQDNNYTVENIIINNMIIDTDSLSSGTLFALANANNITIENVKINDRSNTARMLVYFRGKKNKDINIKDVSIYGALSTVYRWRIVTISNDNHLSLHSENVKVNNILTYILDTDPGTIGFDAESKVYIINNPDDFKTSGEYLTTSSFYKIVYFKHLLVDKAVNYVERDFAKGLLTYIEPSNKFIFWNGTSQSEINTTT